MKILETGHKIIGTEQVTQMESIPKLKISNSYLKRVVKRKHIDYICSKTKRNIGIISRTQGVMPTGSSVQLYKSLLEPYFRYGINTVWELCNDNLIDKLQLLQNRVAIIITCRSCDIVDHPLLLTELGGLDIRQLIMFDLGINRGMTQQSVDNMFYNISDIHHYQIRDSLQDNYFRINRLQKLQFLTVGQNSGMIHQDQSETLLLLRHLKKD